MINSICKVANCRYRHTHVTSGHLCGTCGEFGHGQVECGDINKINQLKNISQYDRVEHRCTLRGCRYQWSHTNEAHHCSKCNGRGHSQFYCTSNIVNSNTSSWSLSPPSTPINNIMPNVDLSGYNNIIPNVNLSELNESLSINSSNPSASLEIHINDIQKYTDLDYLLDCPLCRKENVVNLENDRIYGLEEKCKVCTVNSIELNFKSCKHAILCKECCKIIGKQLSDNNTIDEHL